jgi:predicted transcriptional regulator
MKSLKINGIVNCEQVNRKVKVNVVYCDIIINLPVFASWKVSGHMLCDIESI